MRIWMPNCTTTGRQPIITWVKYRSGLYHASSALHFLPFPPQHSVVCSGSRLFTYWRTIFVPNTLVLKKIVLGLICVFGNGWGMSSWKLSVPRLAYRTQMLIFQNAACLPGRPQPFRPESPLPLPQSLHVLIYVQASTKISSTSKPFPSSPGPLHQNEVKCSAFDIEMIFHSYANKTHFHEKGCVLGLDHFFGTPKSCIRKGLKIFHLHISHNTPCLSESLPHRPKKCISIVFSLSWEDCNTQEEEKVKKPRFCIFLGGSNKVYYGKLLNGEFKVTRPSFFFGGGVYHPTLKLSGIPTITFIVSLTHRMDNR